MIFKHLIYFSRNEFTEPEKMDPNLLLMLDAARHFAGIPFIVNSSYRSSRHNSSVGGVSNSSHLQGLAVDIACSNSFDRFTIINALVRAGFTRIGIGQHHIHCDIDIEKGQDVIWLE